MFVVSCGELEEVFDEGELFILSTLKFLSTDARSVSKMRDVHPILNRTCGSVEVSRYCETFVNAWGCRNEAYNEGRAVRGYAWLYRPSVICTG